jgi:hypothetical protein
VTSIWVQDSERWKLLAPVGFPDEAALHQLIESAPELLPLAGAPRLVVLGREVQLGGGYADLLAVEHWGRLTLVEVKLARNAEARRAVVAQILAYAAYLRGISLHTLQEELLSSQLGMRGHTTISALVESETDQEGSFNTDGFEEALQGTLRDGRFRLVLVLDDAPAELIRLVGYLESIAPELVIDLITVSAYDIEGKRALVPQRVDPGHEESAPLLATPPPRTEPAKKGHRISVEDFERSIDGASAEHQAQLRRMLVWARDLEHEGRVRLFAFRGTTGRTTLLPYLINEDVGLITVWNDSYFYVTPWRSVFERRAPRTLEQLEHLEPPVRIGNGNTIREISDELLRELAAAYREAAGSDG